MSIIDKSVKAAAASKNSYGLRDQDLTEWTCSAAGTGTRRSDTSMAMTNVVDLQEPQRHTRKKPNKVADRVVSFLVDCGLKGTDIRLEHLYLAVEYAYQPTAMYWRTIDLRALIQAIAQRFPNCREALSIEDNIPNTRVLRQVRIDLSGRAFDEANAEMIRNLPTDERPMSLQDVSDWICMQLEKSGSKRKLAYAREDGLRCAERALMELNCLESAACGDEWVRIGTCIARGYRRKCMAERNRAKRRTKHVAGGIKRPQRQSPTQPEIVFD
ncbi:hypothetical protein [Caballeronia sp. NK8]|uniref:hypothetical protein n=1 Tax=Caballeronia sp. NK8 TaxID=140098 RepID=UPI001BD0E24F|nr:hypothetical protein [Caballeronia sp. NK8]